jgi:hypothetical protein
MKYGICFIRRYRFVSLVLDRAGRFDNFYLSFEGPSFTPLSSRFHFVLFSHIDYLALSRDHLFLFFVLFKLSPTPVYHASRVVPGLLSYTLSVSVDTMSHIQ